MMGLQGSSHCGRPWWGVARLMTLQPALPWEYRLVQQDEYMQKCLEKAQIADLEEDETFLCLALWLGRRPGILYSI